MGKDDDCVLLVDDEELVLRELQRALVDEDYETFAAQSGKEALKILAKQTIKVVICDERMPEMSGVDLLSAIGRRYPSTVRIMLAGDATLESAIRAINEGGISRFFSKPWNDLELKLAIRAAIEKYDQAIRLRELMALVRTQQLHIQYLKKALLKKRPSGEADDLGFFLPEMTDQEIERILKECQIH